VHPPTGPGAVSISYGDLRRLDSGEFLNDTLIELGLKYGPVAHSSLLDRLNWYRR
jgi:Ulp1 family protease